MATVTTSRPVTPHKLAEELGGVVINTRGASPESSEAKDVEAYDTDEATLEAAIEAHVAAPEADPAAQDVALTRAREKAPAVLDGTETFTLKELGGVVAALLHRSEA